MDVPAAIRQVREQYIIQGQAKSYYAINDGLCEDFGMAVTGLMGGETDTMFLVGGDNFEEEDGGWDWRLLKKYWSIQPPAGLSRKQVQAIEFGCHVWITDGKRHYDAERPEGVENFFDLPLFRRYIVCWMRENGMQADEVVTEDVMPHPQCLF